LTDCNFLVAAVLWVITRRPCDLNCMWKVGLSTGLAAGNRKCKRYVMNCTMAQLCYAEGSDNDKASQSARILYDLVYR